MLALARARAGAEAPNATVPQAGFQASRAWKQPPPASRHHHHWLHRAILKPIAANCKPTNQPAMRGMPITEAARQLQHSIKDEEHRCSLVRHSPAAARGVTRTGIIPKATCSKDRPGLFHPDSVRGRFPCLSGTLEPIQRRNLWIPADIPCTSLNQSGYVQTSGHPSCQGHGGDSSVRTDDRTTGRLSPMGFPSDGATSTTDWANTILFLV